jgi:hypothetical protein
LFLLGQNALFNLGIKCCPNYVDLRSGGACIMEDAMFIIPSYARHPEKHCASGSM